MLVLSRKVGEQLVIGEEIFVTVLQVDGDRVRLGIAAPESTPIVRSELLPADIAATDRSPDASPKRVKSCHEHAS